MGGGLNGLILNVFLESGGQDGRKKGDSSDWGDTQFFDS